MYSYFNSTDSDTKFYLHFTPIIRLGRPMSISKRDFPLDGLENSSIFFLLLRSAF